LRALGRNEEMDEIKPCGKRKRRGEGGGSKDVFITGQAGSIIRILILPLPITHYPESDL
jgi:hypothetical protein